MSVLILFCASHSLSAAPLVKVEIEGVEAELLTNVELLLTIKQQQEHPLLTSGRIKRLHQKADEEIRIALQTYGYYRVKIEKSLQQQDDDTWLARYVIAPGEALKLRSVTLVLLGEARDNTEMQQLFAAFPLHPGDTLDQVKYEAAKSEIIQNATELGFFDHSFVEHRIDIDLQNYDAAITLQFDSGPRYHFGEITLDQNVLDDAFLRRFLPFAEGDPYSVNELIDLQHALSDSDYFNTIEIEPQTESDLEREVPVYVGLTPRKMNKYTFGLGYGTDTQARGKIGWAVPRVNSKGHRFDSELKASQISQSISANYRIPIGDPRSEQIAISSTISDTNTDTSRSLIRNIGVSLTQRPDKWRRVISLNYQDELYTVADDSGRSTLFMPGVNWTRVWADNIVYVSEGLRLDLGMRGASDGFVSDTSFFQGTAGFKLIRPVFDESRIVVRGRGGSTWTDSFNQLPASVRFFAGGTQSVRGFGYQTLGPVNDKGVVEGGKHLIVGSIEYEHPINPDWSWVLFYDRGNAINSVSDPLEYGAGFGLRWKTPIGPVSFDLASPLSRDGKWRPHINIGPDL